MASIEQVTNCIRCLSIDMVQGAKSGHPGMPMGMAPIAAVLWTEVMQYVGHDPSWVNRDRFLLSNGHGCALQYALLHLGGYELTIDDLKNFRQIDSKTPGHPERFVTPGVEVTTGPLGQGIANAVGLAMAEAHLAATFNRPTLNIVDHWTYVFCGDGCLMEGIGQEALSIAGHLGLEKLVVVYDSNNISIDGGTDMAFTEKSREKYEALGFHVIEVPSADADFDAMRKALNEARATPGKPKMIIYYSTIGYGAKLQGTEKVHGAPLGDDEIAAVKTKFGRDPAKKYLVEEDVREVFRQHAKRCDSNYEKWKSMLRRYEIEYPKEGAQFAAQMSGKLPDGWRLKLPTNDKAIATRKASENCLAALLPAIPALVGGSADLTPSNLTRPSTAKLVDFARGSYDGRYFRFGVREHAMCAILNGIDAHGGLLPFGGTFLNFVGYAFGAVRLAALSHHHVIYVATHDSIGLGEDGPTHQPVELLAALRATPNLLVFRPCDQNETSGAWAAAIENSRGPSVLCLSRQNTVPQSATSIEGVQRGAYVLRQVDRPQLIIVSSGSEVSMAMDAAAELETHLRVRVVSMPCQEFFDAQPLTYRQEVFPDGIPVLSVEPFVAFGWERYSHYHIGMTGFGASGPAEKLYDHFQITKERVVDVGRTLAMKYAEGKAPSKL